MDTNTATLLEGGLVLRTILGFALKEQEDYAVFSSVNKEWNQVAKTIEPPIISQIKSLLKANERLTVGYLPLLWNVFRMMESRSCVLYRKIENGENKWPTLQRQFYTYLHCFAHKFQFGRDEFELKPRLYDLTSEFFERIATRAVENVVQSLTGKLADEVDPSAVVKELVEHWVAWSGTVRAVKSIVRDLDRCYSIPRRGLKTIEGQAQHKLKQAISENLDQIVEPAKKCLELTWDNETTTTTAGMDSQLLVQAFKACEKLRTFQTGPQWADVFDTSQIHERYIRIKQLVEQRMGAS